MRNFVITLAFAISILNTLFAEERVPVGSAHKSKSRLHQSVTGPTAPINEAIAGGATATITVRPVPPKTVPASNYPPGTSIVDTTITLGSVPARVWVETEVTGWAPEVLRTVQVYIDADDGDVDGGGYYLPDCLGEPAQGAGSLFPVIQECTVNTDCRAAFSGITAPCVFGEPSRCINRPFGLGPGPKVCEWGFIDKCDPRYLGKDRNHVAAFALDKIEDSRLGLSFDPDQDLPIDSGPSYLATIVIDVPANAKGSYYLDYDESQTFLQNNQSPGLNDIPIAALNEAVIRVPCGSCCVNPNLPTAFCVDNYSEAECNAAGGMIRVFRADMTCGEEPCCTCDSNSDCNDGDGCTTDVCVDSCVCQNDPVASWNQDTECCNPANGVQTPIPPDSPCQTGGCTLGGSLGAPQLTDLADGSDCVPADPCYLPGQCEGGSCMSEQYVGSDCPKSRFISFDISTGGVPSAYRVKLVSLHHPNPPYRAGIAADFTEFEGEYRWVGSPTMFTESENDLTAVHAAMAGCNPHYRDWSDVDLLHVGGASIVPSSVYEVQSIAEGLDTENEANYSAPITIMTSNWADAVYPYAPHPTVQPNVPDVAEMVNKFRNVPGSISKPRGLFMGAGSGGIPNLAIELDFMQISATVDSFRGAAYPFDGPEPCP